LFAHHRHSLIRGKIVTVIFEHDQIKRRNQPVRSIATSQIDLMIFQCPG
jgi:hypothetical protein